MCLAHPHHKMLLAILLDDRHFVLHSALLPYFLQEWRFKHVLHQKKILMFLTFHFDFQTPNTCLFLQHTE